MVLGELDQQTLLRARQGVAVHELQRVLQSGVRAAQAGIKRESGRSAPLEIRAAAHGLLPRSNARAEDTQASAFRIPPCTWTTVPAEYNGQRRPLLLTLASLLVSNCTNAVQRLMVVFGSTSARHSIIFPYCSGHRAAVLRDVQLDNTLSLEQAWSHAALQTTRNMGSTTGAKATQRKRPMSQRETSYVA